MLFLPYITLNSVCDHHITQICLCLGTGRFLILFTAKLFSWNEVDRESAVLEPHLQIL